MLVIVSPAILVFLWMLSLSLKNEIDNLAYPPVFIPSPPTFANFLQVFEQNSIGRYLWNSIVVSGGATLVALLVGVPAGFGIARLGAQRLIVLILIARMTPALSYLIPLFAVFQFLHLNNTLTALVITHLVITVPIIVYFMAGYFETLPRELEEAALIDGASVWSTFRYVALPLARPGHRRRHDPRVHLLVEQLRLRRRAGRARDADAAGRRLQRADVRAARVGAARRRRDHRHAAGAAAHHRHPEGNRRRTDAWRRQGRLIEARGQSVLKGIHPLLSADLLHALAVDGSRRRDRHRRRQFSRPRANAPRLIEFPGIVAPALLEAVLTLFPLDTRVTPAVYTMEVIGDPDAVPQPVTDFAAVITRMDSPTAKSATSSATRSTSARAARVRHRAHRRVAARTATSCSSRASSTTADRDGRAA